MSARAADLLNKTRSTLWAWCFFLFIYLFVVTFWGVTASKFKHTYSDIPYGVLKSERWSVDFFFTGSLILYFLVPFTMGFALDSPFREWRRRMHLVVLVIGFIYGIVMVGFWGYYYSRANDPSAANAGNPANDDRWCNLYFNLPGSGCPETQPIVGLVPSMLVVNPVFLWKFWFFTVFLLLLVLDFTLTAFLFEPAIRAFRTNDGGDGGAMEEGGGGEDEKQQSLLTPPPRSAPFKGGGGGGNGGDQQQSSSSTTTVYQQSENRLTGPISTRIGRY